ncbi:MAG: site-specific integrase [Actinobacteria bacterium]|nr:site-specific integrase [Actinomycetota bacterium]
MTPLDSGEQNDLLPRIWYTREHSRHVGVGTPTRPDPAPKPVREVPTLTNASNDPARRQKGTGSVYFDASKNRWRGALIAADGTRRRVSATTRDEAERKLAELSDRFPAASTKPRPRRPKGDGSLFYDNTKQTWKGAVTLPNGKRRTVSAATQSEAAAKLRALRVRVGSGGDLDSTLTVAEYLEWWLNTRAERTGTEPGDISPNTLSSYQVALAPVIRELGKRKLHDLAPDHVEWLLRQRAEAGRSRSSVNRTKTVLAQALDTALKRDAIARNVARLAEMPRTATPTPQRALTRAEVTALLNTARGHDLEAFVVIGIATGMRPGELLGLCWDAIDFERGNVAVRRALHRIVAHNGQPERYVLGRVKTPGSNRTLDLPVVVLNVLRSHLTLQKEAQLASPFWDNPDGLLFTNNVGAPVAHPVMTDWLGKLTEKAGIGRWTLTEFARHTAASLMHDAGMPLEAIAEVYGHNTTRTLQRHYVHQIRNSIDHHVAVMDTVLGR